MDSCGMGHIGQQPQGTLLCADEGGTKATDRRNEAVASHDGGDRSHPRFRGGLKAMWRWRRRSVRDFSQEIEAHILLDTDRLIAEGLSPEDARAAALRAFGNVTSTRERFYESGRGMWLDDLQRDVRDALHGLIQNPRFPLVAILTLALGIGANTAIFNLVETVLLRSLPVSHPDELLVFANRSAAAGSNHRFSYHTYQALRQNHTLAGLLASAPIAMNAESDGAPEPTITGQLVSGNYYALLGVGAALGRTIANGDEGAPGTAAVGVLSYGYLQRRFGGDPFVLGKVIRLNGSPFTILGRSAPRFFRTPVAQS